MVKKRFIQWLYIGALLLLIAGSLSARGLLAYQEAVACPGFVASRLIVGEQGRVVATGTANNIRASASSAGEKLGQIAPGGAFVVLEGPLCADGLAWWRVEYDGITGWTAEGSGTDYWLEPAGPLPTQAATVTAFPSVTPAFPETAACPGFLPSRLIVGERGRVVPGPANNLRLDPTSNSQLLAEIRGGSTFLVLEGPVCAGGLAWWRIEYFNTTGWTPEGLKDQYWLEPAGPLPTLAPTLTPSITPTPYPTSTLAPTWTPTPQMPPVVAFDAFDQLVGQTLPSDREAITADNVQMLRPSSIVGRGGVNKIVLSPDGHTVAVLNGLGVWINQIGSDQPGIWLDTAEMPVVTAAFSPDGTMLAVGGSRYFDSTVTGRFYLETPVGTLQLWDMESGERLPFYRTFTENVTSLIFNQDTCCLIVASQPSNRSLNSNLWYASTSEEWIRKSSTLNMEFTVTSITPSRDGDLLAFSDEYSQVSVYSLAANEHQIAYQIEDLLGQVIFSADGTQVMAAGSGGAAQTPGILRVWSLATSERIASPQFNASMRRLALHPDGNLLVIDASSKLLFLDAETFEQEGELQLPLPSKGIVFTPDGQLLLTHVDGTVRAWDIEAETDEIVLDYTGADVGDRAAISPDGRLLAISQNRSREILLLDTATREIVGRFSDDIGALSFMAFDPADDTLHFTISNRHYSWTAGEDEPLQVTAALTPAAVDDELIDTAQTYYPLRQGVNIRQAVPIPNTTLLMVNEGTALTAWDMNTRLPVSSARFYGEILGFSADGTVMLTRTQGAFWLWSISP